MPEVTRFYGMLIKIYLFGDHNPPHFHVIYGDYNGIFQISSLEMIEGDLPNKAQKLVVEWAESYQDELMKMWETKEFKKLPPLV